MAAAEIIAQLEAIDAMFAQTAASITYANGRMARW
jgi:hypothetical protein